MNNCPKCNTGITPGDTECYNCGVIFNKYKAHQDKQEKQDHNRDEAPKSKISLIAILGGAFVFIIIAISGEISDNKASPPPKTTPQDKKAIQRKQQEPHA